MVVRVHGGECARPTRRCLLEAAAAGTPAALLAACGGHAPPALPRWPARVVHVAAFLSQDTGVLSGGERAAVELQRAANAVNQQRLGFEVRVHFMLLPPRPTPSPAGGTGQPSASAATAALFMPTAITLEQALRGGELALGAPPPDLALLTSTFELPTLLGRNLVLPIEQMLKAERSVRMEEFAPGALEAVRTRGRVAALPLSGNVYVLLFNSALFDGSGIARPDRESTWIALVDTARRLTHGLGGQEQWGILAHNSTWLLVTLIWAHGGEVVGKDGRRASLSDVAAREGIEFWASLMLRHRVAPVPPSGLQVSWGYTRSEMWVSFNDRGQTPSTADRRQLAMQFALGSNLISIASQHAPGGQQMRTILAAQVPKARQRATLYSQGASLAVGPGAQDPRLAVRAASALAEHLFQSPVSSFGFPVRRAEVGLLRRVHPQLSEEDADVLVSALGYSRALPPEVSNAIFPVMNERVMIPILSGRASVDEAARAASEALNDTLRA